MWERTHRGTYCGGVRAKPRSAESAGRRIAVNERWVMRDRRIEMGNLKLDGGATASWFGVLIRFA